MKAKSSTCLATFGYFSQTHAPDSPYCLKLKGDFISGPGFPLNTSMSIRCPSRLVRSGFGSKRSTELGAPSMNSQIIDLALAGKCGGRRAIGFGARVDSFGVPAFAGSIDAAKRS